MVFLVVFPQIEVSNEPGQSGIGDRATVVALEDLLDPDDIALGVAKDLPEDRE
jgi:hypothetical protein